MKTSRNKKTKREREEGKNSNDDEHLQDYYTKKYSHSYYYLLHYEIVDADGSINKK